MRVVQTIGHLYPFISINLSFRTMGTRSRLLIRRPGKRTINLWMHWDGYFSGVGTALCKQLLELLTKYTLAQITDMVLALDVKDLDADEGQNFDTGDLIPFIEGKKIYKDDLCEDIQFEYILDFYAQTLTGHNRYEDGTNYTLSFTEILAGQVMTDMREKDETASVVKIIAMFRLLSSEAECDAVRRFLAAY
jgi:hypothetical protein